MPPHPVGGSPTSSHLRFPIVNLEDMEERLEREKKRLTKKVTTTIDGFQLLQACGVEFPDEGLRADISGREATAIQDLSYFPRLATIDASENRLRLDMFDMPRLRHLSLAANQLTDISGGGRLTSLDLSYNKLTKEALTKLPQSLRELDLTCNDLCGLVEMPSRLQKLVVERNSLTDDVWDALKESHLVELQLGYNLLTRGTSGFPELEILGLAYNRIQDMDNLIELSHLPKLELVSLYGNPVVKWVDLSATAFESRQGWSDRKLQIVAHPSDKPRLKVSRRPPVEEPPAPAPKEAPQEEEEVPPVFFEKRDVECDPAKMRAALTALRFTLEHPLTTHDSGLPTGRGGPVPLASRPTHASLCRRRRRHVFEPALQTTPLSQKEARQKQRDGVTYLTRALISASNDTIFLSKAA